MDQYPIHVSVSTIPTGAGFCHNLSTNCSIHRHSFCFTSRCLPWQVWFRWVQPQACHSGEVAWCGQTLIWSPAISWTSAGENMEVICYKEIKHDSSTGKKKFASWGTGAGQTQHWKYTESGCMRCCGLTVPSYNELIAWLYCFLGSWI